MTPEATKLREKLLEMMKGFQTTVSNPEYQIRLLKGLVATGHELLVELRVAEISHSRNP